LFKNRRKDKIMLINQVAVMPLHYLPNIEYMAKFVQFKDFLLEDSENYQKGSFRNRSNIATSLGSIPLSIPLKKGKNNQQSIRDVAIAYDFDWQKQHWQSIKTAYGSAPFWIYYAPIFEKFYQKQYSFLFDLNYEILDTILSILKIKKEINISFTGTYETHITEGVDFRRAFSIKNNFTGKKYAQLFEDRVGFLPNMSALDLVMCCGNQSLEVLTQSSKLSRNDE
jgi:WbqC-like protein family